MSDILAEGHSRESVKHIEKAFKEAYSLSRIEQVGRGAKASVKYLKDSGGGIVDPDGLLSRLQLRYPTARGSAIFVQLEIWDQQGVCAYRLSYRGKEGAATSGASQKMARKLAKSFTSAV